MDDAESISALVALGNTLTWKHLHDGFSLYINGEAKYRIKTTTSVGGQHKRYIPSRWAYWNHQDEKENKSVGSIKAAKQSCEKHFATGEW